MKVSIFVKELKQMIVAKNKSLGRENIVGSCLMILSMAAFAGEDSIIKTLSARVAGKPNNIFDWCRRGICILDIRPAVE